MTLQSDMPVKVIRSPRRRKTVSAGVVKGELIIHIPARMSQREEREWVSRIKERLAKKQGVARKNDAYLKERSEVLNKKYFNGKLTVRSIVYADNQSKRHGSCNTLTGNIRVSRRLAAMPEWVLDYVIVHELAHLVHGDHSLDFWSLVNQYKLAERARGFLIAKDLEEAHV